MQDFLNHIPDRYIDLSPDRVETILRSQKDELFTGIMHLRYPTGKLHLLTFLSGIQQKLYHYQDGRWEFVPQQSWSSTLDQPDASASVIQLSEDALRFLRVAYESPILQTEKLNSSKQELSDHVARWAAGNSPSILHLQAEQADLLCLIAGNSAPIIEELSWVGNGVQYAKDDASFPSRLPLPEYQVTRYVSDGVHEIWQEYELRFAFNIWMRLMFNRFAELAGRILAERLGEQLTTYMTDGKMNVKISINGVANHQYFNSLEEEARVYLELLRRFRDEAGTAVGPRMADALTRDTLLKLDSHRQELLKRHVYDHYMLDDNAEGMGR
jgi:hypothetical protein